MLTVVSVISCPWKRLIRLVMTKEARRLCYGDIYDVREIYPGIIKERF